MNGHSAGLTRRARSAKISRLFLFAIDSLGDRMDMAGLLAPVHGVNFDTSTWSGVVAGLRIRVRVCPVQELESVGFMER